MTNTPPTPDRTSELAPHLELDRAIAALGPKITVLKAIGWPKTTEAEFLAGWRKGAPRIPDPGLMPKPLNTEHEAFLANMRRCDTGHPIGRFLHHTAWSYAVAADMLMHIGLPRFTECSTLLYGRPDFRYRTQTRTNVDAAEAMLAMTDDLVGSYKVPTSSRCSRASWTAARPRRTLTDPQSACSVAAIRRVASASPRTPPTSKALSPCRYSSARP